MITTWVDFQENEQVTITNPDGSFTSMLKSYYDTLPSNSSIPQAGE